MWRHGVSSSVLRERLFVVPVSRSRSRTKIFCSRSRIPVLVKIFLFPFPFPYSRNAFEVLISVSFSGLRRILLTYTSFFWRCVLYSATIQQTFRQVQKLKSTSICEKLLEISVFWQDMFGSWQLMHRRENLIFQVFKENMQDHICLVLTCIRVQHTCRFAEHIWFACKDQCYMWSSSWLEFCYTMHVNQDKSYLQKLLLQRSYVDIHIFATL